MRPWSLWAIFLLMPGRPLSPCELPGWMTAAEVSGVWDLTVESQDGTALPVITLKQEGERITGSYEGKIGVRSLAGTVKAQRQPWPVCRDSRKPRPTTTGILRHGPGKGLNLVTVGGAAGLPSPSGAHPANFSSRRMVSIMDRTVW